MSYPYQVDALCGNWKLTKNSENVELFAKTMGVNLIFRKGGCYITTYEKITQDGNDWEILLTSTFKNYGVKFTIDKEFDEHTVDGRDFKSTFRIEDGKLVHYQKSTKASIPDAKMTRYLENEDTMVCFCEIIGSDLKCTRTHKRYKK